MTRLNGTCKWFNVKKGFGFITPEDGSEDLFVHQSQLKCEGFRTVKEGSKVEYEVITDDNGKLKAVNVTGPEGSFCEPAPHPSRELNSRPGNMFRGGDRFGGNGGGFRNDRPPRDNNFRGGERHDRDTGFRGPRSQFGADRRSANHHGERDRRNDRNQDRDYERSTRN